MAMPTSSRVTATCMRSTSAPVSWLGARTSAPPAPRRTWPRARGCWWSRRGTGSWFMAVRDPVRPQDHRRPCRRRVASRSRPSHSATRSSTISPREPMEISGSSSAQPIGSGASHRQAPSPSFQFQVRKVIRAASFVDPMGRSGSPSKPPATSAASPPTARSRSSPLPHRGRPGSNRTS